MHWRRQWQPTPVPLPGESQGQRNLVGCRLWGCTELDTTSDLAAAAAGLVLRASLAPQLVKNLPAMQEFPHLIPGSERSAGEEIGYPLQYSWAYLAAQLVKKPPAMWETWVPSLGWEDPLEKRMATHSSILAWRIPWTV